MYKTHGPDSTMNRERHSHQNLPDVDQLSSPFDWPEKLFALRSVDESLRCTICKDFFKGPMSLPCGHSFCSLCLRDSLPRKAECPICRVNILGEGDMRPNRALDETVMHFKRCREEHLKFVPSDTPLPYDHRDPLYNMPQSIGVPRESPPRRTPSGSQRHNEQASISYSQVRKTTVTCPICQKQTSAKDVNQHIDSGCKDGLLPSPSIPRSMKAPKPSLHYKDYRDAELRKLLQKDGLPSSGDRQTLIRRLSEWIKRYNANIDEGGNKSTLQLARELGEWERNVNAAKPASFTNTGRHEETSETEQERLRHSRKYHDEYADMIERVRKRKRSSRDAGQVPDEPGSSEINNNAK